MLIKLNLNKSFKKKNPWLKQMQKLKCFNGVSSSTVNSDPDLTVKLYNVYFSV